MTRREEILLLLNELLELYKNDLSVVERIKRIKEIF